MKLLMIVVAFGLLAAVAAADEEKAVEEFFRRAVAAAERGDHAAAIAAFDQCLKLNPKLAQIYDYRGSEKFKLGKVAESLEDFDRFLKLEPKAAPGHWKRGISLYYVGRFEDGKKQFEGYQTTDANDVENAVWHFLCNARAVGVEKARKAVLEIKMDKRVPMMEVYALYKGDLKPADVLAAAEAGSPPDDQKKSRLFYAHLYLGIYFDVLGEKKKALEHLSLAAGKYRIRHYMSDVAKVHEEILRKAK